MVSSRSAASSARVFWRSRVTASSGKSGRVSTARKRSSAAGRSRLTALKLNPHTSRLVNGWSRAPIPSSACAISAAVRPPAPFIMQSWVRRVMPASRSLSLPLPTGR